MMFKKLIIVFMILALSACSRWVRPGDIKDDDLVEVSYEAVDQLLYNLKQPLPKGGLVLINSMINVTDLDQSLPFGRIVSDQITSAMHRAGYRVMGMEIPLGVFAKNDAGILQLPEKTKESLTTLHADALLIGYFAAGRNNIYVSLRIVEIATQNILSSLDYSIPMGPDVKVLVAHPKE